MQGVEAKALRGIMDDLKNQMQSGVIALGLASDDKVNLIAGVTKDLVGKFKAGDLVNHMASQVGGKGGGRPDMAQAGGTQPENLEQALSSVRSWLESSM
jgi:alanyl-tRNA synthetase